MDNTINTPQSEATTDLLARLARQLNDDPPRYAGTRIFKLLKAEEIVFDGMAKRRSYNSFEYDLVEEVVKDNERQRERCIITQLGGRYYWFTGGVTEMHLTLDGPYKVFSALDGSGIVKFTRARENAPFNYVEQRHFGLSITTLWGWGLEL